MPISLLIRVILVNTDNSIFLCKKNKMENNDYWIRERECERVFSEGRPYYMITTENLDWLLYRNPEEFKVGTNLVAVASGQSGFVILDEIQMNNHHHVLGEGSLTQAEHFTQLFREKERRFQLSLGNPSLKKWNIRIDETLSLKQFRNQVGYINRNAYVVRLDSTPTGYPWGSGNLFFNGNLWQMQEGVPFGELSIDYQREICRSHQIRLPEQFRVLDGMILRQSFVNYRRTESFFNSANQYFSYLTKRGEADVEIANMLGERIQLPNEEVFQIVGGWYPGESIGQWKDDRRFEAAKRMKSALRCSNKQITQVLRLPPERVDQMFPQPR